MKRFMIIALMMSSFSAFAMNSEVGCSAHPDVIKNQKEVNATLELARGMLTQDIQKAIGMKLYEQELAAQNCAEVAKLNKAYLAKVKARLTQLGQTILE